MTWENFPPFIIGIIAFGAFASALPPVWRFVRATAKVPSMIESIVHEFSPNSGSSMRDAINRLCEDVEHLRESNHAIKGNLSVNVAATVKVMETVQAHTVHDEAQFGTILVELAEAKQLAADVKRDLTKFNEIDQLGRENRIERRNPE